MHCTVRQSGAASVAREHQHAGGVVVGILDVLRQHLEIVDPGGQRRGDGADALVADLGDLARGARGVGMDQRREAVLLQEVAALRQRLDVALHRLDGLQRGAGQGDQAVLDPLEMLGDDLEPGVRQQAVQVGDAAGDRVLDRDDGELRLARLDRAHRRLEGRTGQRRHVGKGRAAGHVGIGARLALKGDRVGGLQRLRHLPKLPRALARHCPVGRLFRPLDKRRQPAGRAAKNLAKSGTCDVPPREPAAAIGYYWRRLRACYSNGRNFWRSGI